MVAVVAAVLFVLFVVVPFAELYVILQVAHAVGGVTTIAILVAMSFLGAALVKREGLGVLRRAQQRMNAGQVPGRELVDGVLILLSGALLLTPGFLTDAVGVLLLLPPVRAGMRAFAIRRLRHRVVLR
jgi:UPF0716 protein FxsA